MTTLTHTPAQKRRLLALASYLDKLPRKKLRMRSWQFNACGVPVKNLTNRQIKHECRTAACACGHAVFVPSIRRITKVPTEVPPLAFGIEYGIGFGVKVFRGLFGGARICTPRQLARDLRRYVKDGTLPQR
jgi:hypothetical protein